MKTTSALLAVCAMSVPALAVASAPVTENSFTRGKSAWGSVENSDGCNYTIVSVTAADSVYKQGPGAPEPTNDTAYVMFRQSLCDGTSIQASALVPLTAPLTMDSYAVTVSLPALHIRTWFDDNYDIHNDVLGQYALNATITVQGTGAAARTTSGWSFHDGGDSARYTLTAVSRPATVTAQATLDGTPVALGTGTGALAQNGEGWLLVVHQ